MTFQLKYFVSRKGNPYGPVGRISEGKPMPRVTLKAKLREYKAQIKALKKKYPLSPTLPRPIPRNVPAVRKHD